MPQLNIKNEEAHELAAELSRMTGDSLTTVVTEALRERLERAKRHSGREGIAERLLALGREISKLPVLDPRPIQEIMDDMYDEDGLPK